jgi:hypothetical protein
LDEAQRFVGFHVLRPDDSLASDQTITRVWINLDSPMVGIEYSSGLRVYLNRSETDDPVTNYTEQQAEGIPGTLEQIRGTTAFVVAEDKSIGAPGSVDMVIDGIEVALIGHFDTRDFSVDELVRIASSVS